jgi:hypothetical protein
MKKFLEDFNRRPRVIYLAGVALGIIMTNWYDTQSGSSRWLILLLGLALVTIGVLGMEEKK